MCCNTRTNLNGGPRWSPRRSSRRARRGRPGFSFIEIMVVVVIIGLLAGAVAMKVTGYMDTAKVNRAKSDIAVIVNAIEARYLETSRYPANEEGLDELPLKNRTDPWGNPYQYNSPGRDDEPFEVFTFGADEREGGEGINRDVYSWQLGDVDEEG